MHWKLKDREIMSINFERGHALPFYSDYVKTGVSIASNYLIIIVRKK